MNTETPAPTNTTGGEALTVILNTVVDVTIYLVMHERTST